MKKKATARAAKATSRQSTLNFPPSSEADLVAESPAAETSVKSGAKNHRKRTADFADDADKQNETNGDSSAPVSSAPTERNMIAQGKKRSVAALGQHPSTTESPEGATEPSSSAKNHRKRTADFADDADKQNETNGDSSAPVSSAPTERNMIAQGKKRSATALGQHPSTTESPEGATEPSSSAKNRMKRTADFADDTDKPNKPNCDSSAISAQSAVKTKSRHEGTRITVGRPSCSNLPLSDLVHSIDQGWSPRCENYAASSQLDWAVIKTTAIQNLHFLDEENKALPSTLEPRKHLELRPGDLLITRAGPRNRVGVACLVRSTRPRLMLCDKAYRLKCRLDVVEPAFLELALNSPDLVSQVNKLKTGINDSGVNITQTPFMNLEIPVPPIAEQHRIVAEIEKQFTRLDAGVAALKRVQANLKRYRAAVLKAACEGKLVPTEAELKRTAGKTPPFETGEQLLQRILIERRQNWLGRGIYKEPVVPDSAGLPVLPEGWVWGSLEQLAWSSSYGTSAKCSADNTGPPVLRIPNIAYGKVELTNLKFAGDSDSIEDGDELAPGDLLIIRTNGSKNLIGRSAVVRNNLDRPTDFASYLIRFRLLGSSTLFDWLSTIWDVSFLRAWIEQRAATSAGQHNISMSVLNTMPMALPPLAEQTRIVAEVERRLSVVDELEAVVSANLQRAARLRQSILQKAFTGELTGTDTCHHGLQVQQRRN